MGNTAMAQRLLQLTRTVLTNGGVSRCRESVSRRSLCTQQQADPIDCLIFGVDDTLYPVSNGFSQHRLTEVAIDYMVDQLGFADRISASQLWAKYFAQHHSTVKALTIASNQGQLPPLPDGSPRVFDPEELSEYLATNCDFDRFLAPNPQFASQLAELKQAGLKLVVMTNAPKAYGVRCLETLQLAEYFEP